MTSKAAILLIAPLLLCTSCADPKEKADVAYSAGDYPTALIYYRRSASRGNNVSQEKLGEMYEKGQGTAPNDDETVAWYKKAAEQGNVRAQVNLGFFYLTGGGPGVVHDYNAAFQWLKKAADQGDIHAQAGVGYIYAIGISGVPQNYSDALSLLTKASDQGDAFAQVQLGIMYYAGQGIAQDPGEALKYFQKAALAEDARGMSQLGIMYQNGSGGVAQDYVEADRWFLDAIAHGNAGARVNSNTVQKNMTLAQIQEAQKRASIDISTSAPHP